MDLPAPDPRRGRTAGGAQAGLHDVTAAAARWFSARLQSAEGAAARAYLDPPPGCRTSRSPEFAIGYAPDRRDAIAAALPQLPRSADWRSACWCEARGCRAAYDRFRDRLVIPIHDARGRVIGFGGAHAGRSATQVSQQPGHAAVRQGPHAVQPPPRRAGRAPAGRLLWWLGYLDVIALAGAGVEEAVAPLGTAVTEAQLELLWRHVDVPVLCFDGDAAGQRAAMRAAERALPLLKGGRSLAFVTLPAGQDPDDLVRAAAGFARPAGGRGRADGGAAVSRRARGHSPARAGG